MHCGRRHYIRVADTGLDIGERIRRLRWRDVESELQPVGIGTSVFDVLDAAIVMPQRPATRSIEVVLELARAD